MTAVLEIQGRGRTAYCRPVQSFSQVSRQVGMKDEDGLRFAVPSRPGLLAVPPPGPTEAPDDCEHWYNRTPLECAALGGHEGVAKLLLGREDIHPNKLDDLDSAPPSSPQPL